LSLSHPRPQAGASVVPASPSSSSRRVCFLCLTLVLKQARLLSLSHPRPQAGARLLSLLCGVRVRASPSSSSRRPTTRTPTGPSPTPSTRRPRARCARRGRQGARAIADLGRAPRLCSS
jgi:hypothetical protein